MEVGEVGDIVEVEDIMEAKDIMEGEVVVFGPRPEVPGGGEGRAVGCGGAYHLPVPQAP